MCKFTIRDRIIRKIRFIKFGLILPSYHLDVTPKLRLRHSRSVEAYRLAKEKPPQKKVYCAMLCLMYCVGETALVVLPHYGIKILTLAVVVAWAGVNVRG